ncbi:MAG TPA: hypothetical protein PK950_01865 [Candidatus Paceibacterota bacterium]|nr:hypothetical protein [Candidatus Paceibacterota bacterium]
MLKKIAKGFGIAVLSSAVVVGSFGLVARQASATQNAAAPTITVDSLQICVRTSGVAFVVGYGFKKADCRRNDKLVTIIKNGAVGAQGPVGNKGPTGDKGPVGDKGLQGDKGEIGDKGPTGDRGPTGSSGSQGPAGEKGPTGDRGEKGETGDKGPTGDKGERGEQGLPGPAGSGGSGETLAVMRVMGTTSVYTEPSSGTGVSSAGAQVFSTATCPEGSFILGGGAEVTTSDTGKEKVVLAASYPSDVYNWQATAAEVADLVAGKTMTLTAYAICKA